MAYIPLNSIVAVQSNPSVLQATVGLNSTNASVITAPIANQSVSGIVGASVVGHAPVVIVGGSILTSPTPNQSVSGTIQTDVRGSVATVIIGGSIAASFTPPANQSVSGTVGASVLGVVPIVGSQAESTSGPVASTLGVPFMAYRSDSTPPVAPDGSLLVLRATSKGELYVKSQDTISVNVTNTNQNVSGSVVAFQGTVPWANTNVGSIITVGQGSIAVNIISGSIAATFTPPANQSVSGTVGARLESTNASVITVGTAAPNQSVSGTVQTDVRGSIAAVIIGGSIATATTNSSVMLLNGANVIGSVTVLQGTNPFIITGSIQGGGAGTQYAEDDVVPSVTGTAVMFRKSQDSSIMEVVNPLAPLPVVGSVSGQVGASIIGLTPVNVSNTNINVSGSVVAFGFPTTQNVSGSVASYPQGTIVTSLVSTVPSSVIVGTSIFGQLPAGTAPLGSVATLQGTNPWLVSFGNSSIFTNQTGSVITVFKDSSILAVPVGSVITVLQGASIVGSYAEDAAHTTADKGLFILGVRNDAVSSITSAERDYSPVAVDEVGRNIVVPFAGQNACIISYFGSIVSGSVQLIQPSVIGNRSYITDLWLSNTGSTTTLVTLQGGDTSILGQFIVPAGGGSNSPGIAIPLRTTRSQDLAFKVAPSQSILYAVIKGYQAP